MLDGPERYKFSSDRLFQAVLGILLLPVGVALLGLFVVQVLIKAGTVNLIWSGSSENVHWGSMLVALLAGSVVSMVSIVQIIGLFRGLPRLTPRADGIEYQTVIKSFWARWSSLSSFEIIKIQTNAVKGHLYRRVIRTQIIGPNVSPNLAGKTFLAIENEFNHDPVDIANQATALQNTYLYENPDEKISLRISKI